MPVQRDDDRGDLVARSRPRAAAARRPAWRPAAPPRPRSRRSSSGSLPQAQLGGPVQVVVALGLLGLPPHLLESPRAAPAPGAAPGARPPTGPACASASARRSASSLRRSVQAGLAGRVVLLGQRGLLDLQPHHPAGELVELGRHRVDLGAEHRAGLVDQVDRLVRQEPVGDVAVAERRPRRPARCPAIFTPWKTSSRSRRPRRIETASSTDGSSTMTGWNRRSRAASFSMRLRYSSSVVAPIMCSSPRASIGLSMLPASIAPSAAPAPDDGVQLVDEQQDAALRGLDLGQDGLEPLLELAAVLGPGHQRAHVEGEDRLVPQPFGHVAADDPLGQALHDGGLAHARVADQDRVVLGLAGQDLDDPPDLGVPADDRVEPAAGRVGDQVAAVLLQRLVGALRHGRGDPLVAADLGQRLQEAVPGQAVLLEQPAGRGGRRPRRAGPGAGARPRRTRP